ncbi:gag-pol polyprotein, partial [Trifolium medium]|nr:gag-pol polyprotein [Trifolium medium]
MDPKSNEGIFLGYSTNSRAYKVFNSRTNTMMESINVVIDDSTTDKVTDEEADATASDQQPEATEDDCNPEQDSEVTNPEPENT